MDCGFELSFILCSKIHYRLNAQLAPEDISIFQGGFICFDKNNRTVSKAIRLIGRCCTGTKDSRTMGLARPAWRTWPGRSEEQALLDDPADSRVSGGFTELSSVFTKKDMHRKVFGGTTINFSRYGRGLSLASRVLVDGGAYVAAVQDVVQLHTHCFWRLEMWLRIGNEAREWCW